MTNKQEELITTYSNSNIADLIKDSALFVMGSFYTETAPENKIRGMMHASFVN